MKQMHKMCDNLLFTKVWICDNIFNFISIIDFSSDLHIKLPSQRQGVVGMVKINRKPNKSLKHVMQTTLIGRSELEVLKQSLEILRNYYRIRRGKQNEPNSTIDRYQ